MNGQFFDLFDVEPIRVPSVSVLADDLRLNADYFLESGNIEYHGELAFQPLSDLADVFFPGIFKRVLVDEPEEGVPFITTATMMECDPRPDKYLSRALTPNLHVYQVKKDWLLVSRSGTIGNTVFATDYLTRFAITEDALRVMPKNAKHTGFLYFYFTSNYGRDKIVGKKGGAVVDHIYEEDLLRLSVPIINETVIDQLDEEYQKVRALRESANSLLTDADELIYKYNNLPSLNPGKAYYYEDNEEVQIRILPSITICDDYRLDAHYYNPLAELAIANIEEGAADSARLEELTKAIVLGKRFKRNYVKKEFGTPFIGSKNILQIRPELKYLSNIEISFMSELLLQRNYILIACSGSLGGTFGRAAFVFSNYESCAASQHILRVIPDETRIDPAYLFAFLNCEYGYKEITRFRWGALIDEIDNEDMKKVIVPICNPTQQKAIGDKVRLAYEQRAKAIRLENEAQAILKEALTA